MWSKIESRRPERASAVRSSADVAQSEPIPSPVDVAGDVGNIEFPKVEGPPIDIEIKVGIFGLVHRDDAMNTSDGRFFENIRFHDFGDMGTDGSGHYARIGEAEAVGEVDLLCRNIDDQAGGAEFLGGDLRVSISEFATAVGQLKS